MASNYAAIAPAPAATFAKTPAATPVVIYLNELKRTLPPYAHLITSMRAGMLRLSRTARIAATDIAAAPATTTTTSTAACAIATEYDALQRTLTFLLKPCGPRPLTVMWLLDRNLKHETLGRVV